MDRILKGVMRYRGTTREQMVKEFKQVKDNPHVSLILSTSDNIVSRFGQTLATTWVNLRGNLVGFMFLTGKDFGRTFHTFGKHFKSCHCLPKLFTKEVSCLCWPFVLYQNNSIHKQFWYTYVCDVRHIGTAVCVKETNPFTKCVPLSLLHQKPL